MNPPENLPEPNPSAPGPSASSPGRPSPPHTPLVRRRAWILLLVVALGAAVATLVVTYVLVRMFEHKADARRSFVAVATLDETSTDPAPWGLNWPHHFDQYRRTAGDTFQGGSSALPESKLDTHPWLRRLYAGYAFALDYREARGHAYMLYDQVVTRRVNERPQAGACLHCHASATVLYRKLGLEALGRPATPEALAADFNMPAVIKGFEVLSTRPYHEVLALLTQVPDGTPPPAQGRVAALAPAPAPTFEAPPVGGFDVNGAPGKAPEGHFALSEAHPVACIDCHQPQTMALRVTRPGFVQGIAALAAGPAPVPHLPSIERWRAGKRTAPYDPNALASRQELRSMVCGQCHVEYYCGDKDTLRFPWGEGLNIDDIERFWEQQKFPDGSAFYDYKHGETGAPLFKAQHPEFELWSQGVHAQAGVGCSDCHMPYERVGAMKLSNHTVRSPMENLTRACQTCHNVPEAELRDRVVRTQGRTQALMTRSAAAMTDMLDAVLEAKAAGADEAQLASVYALQRKAMWRLDFISSENSKGFHAPQESARILADSIDFSRQAQAAALRLRAPAAPSTEHLPRTPVEGTTPGR